MSFNFSGPLLWLDALWTGGRGAYPETFRAPETQMRVARPQILNPCFREDFMRLDNIFVNKEICQLCLFAGGWRVPCPRGGRSEEAPTATGTVSSNWTTRNVSILTWQCPLLSIYCIRLGSARGSELELDYNSQCKYLDMTVPTTLQLLYSPWMRPRQPALSK